MDDKLLHGEGSPLLPMMGPPAVKLRAAERALYLAARSVKSRYIAGDALLTVIKRMRRMNERESEIQHATSTLRSIALNEDREEDDPLIICMETMDTSGMFWTLVLT